MGTITFGTDGFASVTIISCEETQREQIETFLMQSVYVIRYARNKEGEYVIECEYGSLALVNRMLQMLGAKFPEGRHKL